MEPEFIPCSIKQLPEEMQVEAARVAVDYNPANRCSTSKLMQVLERLPFPTIRGLLETPDAPTIIEPLHLAMMTEKYWGPAGVKLTVGFPFDATPMAVQLKIVQHMNAWSQFGNITFVLTGTDPQVRITTSGDGYWSYLGVDILSIAKNQPTMCLQGFSLRTSDSEYARVVRHETGHTLGCPHEHMRTQLVARLNVQKTLDYFQRTQGWSNQVTKQQVLTALSERAITGTLLADQDSIMCYQLPGSITNDGQPIRGGTDINVMDQTFIAKMYPLSGPIKPPPLSGATITIKGIEGWNGEYPIVKP